MLAIGATQPLDGRRIGPEERELLRYDGRRAPVLAGSFPFPGPDAEGIYIACDLSGVRRADEARRQADLLHAAILASIHDQIVVLDTDGIIIEVNEPVGGVSSVRRFTRSRAHGSAVTIWRQTPPLLRGVTRWPPTCWPAPAMCSRD